MAIILNSQPGVWFVPAPGTLARAPVSGGAPREVAENVSRIETKQVRAVGHRGTL
jgi:hypothetical protein